MGYTYDRRSIYAYAFRTERGIYPFFRPAPHLERFGYHVTKTEYLNTIAREGLKPSARWGFVFFSAHVDDYKPKRGEVVLRFPLQGVVTYIGAPSKFDPDEFTVQRVRPDHIEILHKGRWVPLKDVL